MQLAKESSFFQEVLCLENISVVQNTKLSIKCIVSPGSIQISKSYSQVHGCGSCKSSPFNSFLCLTSVCSVPLPVSISDCGRTEWPNYHETQRKGLTNEI